MAEEHFSHPEPPDRKPALEAVSLAEGHEERDVRVGPIALATAGIATLCITAVVAMLVLFNVLAGMEAKKSKVPSPLAAYGPKQPPEPRLQDAPLLDLQQMRARDAETLSAYAWVDRDAGVVRIPIERAIELLASRGLPAREAKPREAKP